MPELDKARYGAPSRTLTWAITAFVASLPANLGCIAGCAAFLALYDRHVPAFTVPTGTAGAGAGSGVVGLPPHMGAPTIVRIVTEAEATQMRMAAQPPPTVGSVPGFDLVAVPRGVLDELFSTAGAKLYLLSPCSSLFAPIPMQSPPTTRLAALALGPGARASCTRLTAQATSLLRSRSLPHLQLLEL